MQSWFRRIMLAFSGVLAIEAIWLLAAELSRPAILAFPVNAAAARVPVLHRDRAIRAAAFGIVRGDLWAERALSYADLSWGESSPARTAEEAKTFEKARIAAQQALRYAPHDARVWVLLASLESRLDWLNRRAAEALKMSYYTGSYEAELSPLRLLVAVRADTLSGGELQELVRGEIRRIISQRPAQKPAILAAYRDAQPTGRRFIETTLEELDAGQSTDVLHR
jgi:hypothetical protein